MMVKKLFSYILSASLLFSSGQDILAKAKNLQQEIKDNWKTILKWGAIGTAATAGVIGVSYGISRLLSNQTNTQFLISKLKKDNLGVTDQKIKNVIACSAIQGLAYFEGTNRYAQKNRHGRLLNELIATLILLRSYDTLNVFFGLDKGKNWNKPDLLRVSRTRGDSMVRQIAHVIKNEDKNEIQPIRDAKKYMQQIKEEFDKLDKEEIMSKIGVYGEKTDVNMNAKTALLVSLKILNLKSEKLMKLVDSSIENMYKAFEDIN